MTNVESANKSGMHARGTAIAENLLNALKDQGMSLKRFLVDVFELDQEGRKAFRVTITNNLNEMRKFVKEHKGTDQAELFAKTLRSATVRVSEAMNFSKAIDAGYDFQPEKDSYHSAVASSRMYLKSVGAGSNRGKKTTSAIVKIKDYLSTMVNKGSITPKELIKVLNEVVEGLTLMSKPSKVVEEKEAKIERSGPTRRKESKTLVGEEKRMDIDPTPPFGIERRAAEESLSVH